MLFYGELSRTSAVMIRYEVALYQMYAPLPLPCSRPF